MSNVKEILIIQMKQLCELVFQTFNFSKSTLFRILLWRFDIQRNKMVYYFWLHL